MGGDVVAGTTFVEALPIFEEDDNTEGIILVGEVGGRAEEEAAEWIMQYRMRTENPKPIMAVVGGVHAPRGRIMGHAGAWAAPGEADAADKVKVLEKAGVVVVDHPEKFGEEMKNLLSERQKRHSFSISGQALNLLRERNIPVSETIPSNLKPQLLAISVDRTLRKPCVAASPSINSSNVHRLTRRFPFEYGSSEPTSLEMVESVTAHLSLQRTAEPLVQQLLEELSTMFMSHEAFVLSTHFTISPTTNDLLVHWAGFGFDDAAFRSSGRQSSIHALRDTSVEDPLEVSAEPYGIIYVKLEGEGSIGTLVNGAGLAMNTVDALVGRGGYPANFVDTGGKATSETIKAAFEVITRDERVKTILVNIFGGLTRCEMIAEGILMAFKELNLKMPVVVRLRGTNEKLGQEVIRNSGLPIDAYDGFEDAAARVIELARVRKGVD
ncbi:MAG: hypothetical protein Q9160_000943 [Pyrenula sp. 1 TL-2023]